MSAAVEHLDVVAAGRPMQRCLGVRTDELTGTADPAVQATVLRAAGDPPAAWERLAELPDAVADRYWQDFSYIGIGTSFGHVLEAARCLTDAGRHAAALELIALYESQTDTAEAAEVAATACERLLAGGLTDPELPRLARHDVERLFELLAHHRGTVGRQRVVNIEWQLFPALGFDADAPTLHAALAEDPAFFAELVGYAYRRDGEDGETEDTHDSEQRRLVAERAHEVLQSWQQCRGTGTDDAADLPLLRAWLLEARSRLGDDAHLGPGDEEIGRVLASAAPDPDGLLSPGRPGHAGRAAKRPDRHRPAPRHPQRAWGHRPRAARRWGTGMNAGHQLPPAGRSLGRLAPNQEVAPPTRRPVRERRPKRGRGSRTTPPGPARVSNGAGTTGRPAGW